MNDGAWYGACVRVCESGVATRCRVCVCRVPLAVVVMTPCPPPLPPLHFLRCGSGSCLRNVAKRTRVPVGQQQRPRRHSREGRSAAKHRLASSDATCQRRARPAHNCHRGCRARVPWVLRRDSPWTALASTLSAWTARRAHRRSARLLAARRQAPSAVWWAVPRERAAPTPVAAPMPAPRSCAAPCRATACSDLLCGPPLAAARGARSREGGSWQWPVCSLDVFQGSLFFLLSFLAIPIILHFY